MIVSQYYLLVDCAAETIPVLNWDRDSVLILAASIKQMLFWPPFGF